MPILVLMLLATESGMFWGTSMVILPIVSVNTVMPDSYTRLLNWFIKLPSWGNNEFISVRISNISIVDCNLTVINGEWIQLVL